MEADAFMAGELVAMGFDQDQVNAALIATNNISVDAALEAILSGSYPFFSFLCSKPFC